MGPVPLASRAARQRSHLTKCTRLMAITWARADLRAVDDVDDDAQIGFERQSGSNKWAADEL